MYLYLSMGVMRKKSVILRAMERAPGVEIVLLSNSLMASRSIVGVPQYPGLFSLLPPSVRRVRLGSDVSGT